MQKYVIDGLFLTQRITGIQRYAYEITLELDKLVEKGAVQILVPKAAQALPQLQNIEIVYYGNHKGIAWQQIDLAGYLSKNKVQGIFFTNVLPLLYAKGIITVHDVCYKANPQFFASAHDRISMLWHRLNYWRAAHSDVSIVTDSECSKNEISKHYNVALNRISIIYCGWLHMQQINMSSDTFERYPMLEKGKYYFSMATLGANKNFKWILYAAKNSPNETFAIAGGGKLKGAAEAAGFANLPNVHFLGYVSDEDAKTLMASCKAFLFPTLYEGFGIPPLEAVACGAKHIIVSDTPCMHEIYGDNAEYIDPTDYENAGIPTELKEVGEALLNKYSWEKSAQKLNCVMKNRVHI